MYALQTVTDAEAGSKQASQIAQLLQAGAVYLTGKMVLTIASCY